MNEEIKFAFTIDCEATQPAIDDPDLGKRATRGLADILEERELKGTFFCIPSELTTHGSIYREIEKRGHEVGLHMHPADQGYAEFLGLYGPEDQERIIGEAADVYAQQLGRPPRAFSSGYGSGNDHTFPVLEKLGFRHGVVGIPTRVLPEVCAVWAGMPFGCYYPNRWFRTLEGDVDFVQVSTTVDPESRMWGGKHPQDLRVELVDAKNHWYTIDKAVKRQLREHPVVSYVSMFTHNTYDYNNEQEFRRETMIQMIDHAKDIFSLNKLSWQAATIGEIAEAFRTAKPDRATPELNLARRGHAANDGSS